MSQVPRRPSTAELDAYLLSTPFKRFVTLYARFMLTPAVLWLFALALHDRAPAPLAVAPIFVALGCVQLVSVATLLRYGGRSLADLRVQWRIVSGAAARAHRCRETGSVNSHG